MFRPMSNNSEVTSRNGQQQSSSHCSQNFPYTTSIMNILQHTGETFIVAFALHMLCRWQLNRAAVAGI